MELFDTLPENFFNLLTGKNKEIYAASLILLTTLLEHEELTIRKEDYVRSLHDLEISWTTSFEFEEGDLNNEAPNVSSKINYVVRRLEECGWIELEIDPNTFDEHIALPIYTIQLISTLRDILSSDEATYNSLVHSTYSELKIEDENPDEYLYTALMRAYENTKRLRTDLVTLGHSIRIFKNKLGRLFSANDVLKDHFDRFKEKVSNRYYHPLKTFDSVTRFRRPIVNILNHWLNDREIRQSLVQQSLLFSKNRDRRSAEEEVIAKINYISDMYEQFESMIGEIDEKHTEYTKSSITKILYLNNSDKTIKGHLETIFKHYSKVVNGGQGSLRFILDGMQDSIYFYDQGFIDSDSVTLPINRKRWEEQEPMPIMDFDDLSPFLMEQFLKHTKEGFNDQKVYEFMEVAFGERNMIATKEIPLPNLDAFLLLILAAVKSSNNNSFYEICNIDTTDYIQSYGYLIPNFIFQRKIEGE